MGIDVTELLVDPDVGGNTLLLIRRPQAVNNYGESVDANDPIAIIGSAYPTGSNSLVREAAFSSQTDTITVCVRYPISGPSEDAQGKKYDADIIGWKGNFYIVKDVNNFSAYGPGFVEAECEAIDYNIKRATPPADTTGNGDLE